MSKIFDIMLAPYTGVYDKLDEVIDNEIVKWLLYFVWCFTFGWLTALGVLFTVVWFKMRFLETSEEED